VVLGATRGKYLFYLGREDGEADAREDKVKDAPFEEDGYEDSGDEEIIYYDEDGKVVKKRMYALGKL
jgi:hypothetical protein